MPDPSKDSGHRSTPCSFEESGYGYGEFLADSCASELSRSSGGVPATTVAAAHRPRARKGTSGTAPASLIGDRRSASPLPAAEGTRPGKQRLGRRNCGIFVGREWAYDKVARVLQQVSECRGVVVTGGPGTGKSAFIEQLYQLSPLGDGHGSTIQSQDVLLCLRRTLENGRMSYNNSPSNSPAGTLMRTAAAASMLDGGGGGSLAPMSCVDVNGGGVMPLAAPNSSLRYVAALVVACHVCSADDATTCSPADLVQSVAAQLMRCPRLGPAYCQALRDGGGDSPRSRASVLSGAECVRDPLGALARAVFEPLAALREQGAVDGGDMIVLIDGLSDAELHRPDGGADGMASFLAKALAKCPPFVRFIVSARSSMADVVEPLCFFPISFDLPPPAAAATGSSGGVLAERQRTAEGGSAANADHVRQDVMEYATYRIYTSDQLRANMCVGGSSSASAASSAVDGGGSGGGSFQTRVCEHLQALSRGSFLYCKLVLDLVERGQLVLKTANFKIVPVTLGEVFLLSMNLRFPGLRAFERALPLLNVCLASLRPLAVEELYDCINAGHVDTCVPWDDFRQRLGTLEGLLVEDAAGRSSSSGCGGDPASGGSGCSGRSLLTFFHPTFREWLAKRDDGESTKFLCDVKAGHTCIALYQSRSGRVLSEAAAVELGHHILKAHLYKSSPGLVTQPLPSAVLQQPPAVAAVAAGRVPLPGELQACWMALAVSNPTSGLTCPANLFLPNVNVSRLLLLAGGDANAHTDFYGRAPLLCVAAREGFTDVVNVLLEFGADVDGVSADGQTALCYAAARGHLNVAKALKDHGAQIAYLDNSGRCPLIHAAVHGHLELVKFLVSCLRQAASARPHQHDMIVSALVSTAVKGHTEVMEFLLDVMSEVGVGGCDSLDGSLGETALTAACLYGRRGAVELLLGRGASARKPNSKSFTPLLCAAKGGHCLAAEAVLRHAPLEALNDTDKHGRTALAVAAAEGHIDFVSLLLGKGVPADAEDKEGLSALSWACVKGRPRVARLLLDQRASLEHVDRSGRGPLDLAVLSGDAELVHLLIEWGASTERPDASGVRPLDRAIELRHLAAARCLLRKNARLTQATWAAAGDDAGALHLLLAKLLDDGSALYRKGRVKDAAARYQYALKHCPAEEAAVAADRLSLSSSGASCAAAASPTDGNEGFAAVRHCAMVSLSKCCRKLGDMTVAVDLATAALQQQQQVSGSAAAMYEAYCCRARALRDSGQLERALEDLAAAERLALPGGARGLRRLATRMREESKQQLRLASTSTVCGGSSSSLDDECDGGGGERLENGEANSRGGGNVAAAVVPSVVVPSVVVSATPPVRRRAEETAL